MVRPTDKRKENLNFRDLDRRLSFLHNGFQDVSGAVEGFTSPALRPATTQEFVCQGETDVRIALSQISRYIPASVVVTVTILGTHTFLQPVFLEGFCGGGILVFQGNVHEVGAGTKRTNQSTSLLFPNGNGFDVTGCDVSACFTDMKVESRSGGRPVKVERGVVYVMGMYLLGNSTSAGRGVQVAYGQSEVRNTYVENLAQGLFVNLHGRIHSRDNSSTGTIPAYGLDARRGGVISKEGTQPAGSTANESTVHGGDIR
jgi:hypothetical protein